MNSVSGVKASFETSCSSDGDKARALLGHGCKLTCPSSSSSCIKPGADLVRESFLRTRSNTGIVVDLGERCSTLSLMADIDPAVR